MPFTLAHAAAAIPFRRTGLVPSAVVVGCFAPDFLYFLRLAPRGRFGHTWPGIFALDLPLALLVLWLFHRYAKEPLWLWMPKSFRERVQLGPRTLNVRSVGDFALLLVSILVGIATHILWDSFTHRSYWPYHHLSLLRDTLQLPVIGRMPYYNFFQQLSSIIGMLVILIWFLRLPRSSPLHQHKTQGSGAHERRIFVVSSAVALLTGFLRAFIGAGGSIHPRDPALFVAEVIVTTISVFWLELVLYGVLRARNTPDMEAVT
jgi:Domain of unknown function (DUF4184)